MSLDRFIAGPDDATDAAPRMVKVEIDAVEIPFADLDTLLRSKQTARLPDQADVETLERLKPLQAGQPERPAQQR